MKKALICGRGKSLSYYENLLNEKFDHIYLVNEFNKFIVEEPKLLEFFKNKKNEGSTLIQQVNIQLSGLDENIVKELIDECFCTRLSYKNSEDWWRDNFDQYRFYSWLGVRIKPQPESLEPFMSMVKNSLGVAILNAIIDKNCEELTIIGSDFYEADYFLSHRDLDWHEVSQKEVQDRLKSGFTDLVKRFDNCKFNLKTSSSYSEILDNCNITYVK